MTRPLTPNREPGTARAVRAARIGLWYRFCRLVCRLVWRSFFRLKTWGLERVPLVGGAILACNHQSYMDPPIATCMLPRECRYMARSSLFRLAPFAWLIRSVGAIPVNRGESDRAALRRAEDALRAGWLLTLFPEGTRTADGYLGEVKPGVGSLAVRAGVPVLPCYIHGAFDAWPRWARLPRPRPIDVFYGELVELPDDSLSRKRRAAQVNEKLAAALKDLERSAFALKPLRTRSAPTARAGDSPVGSSRVDPPVRAETADGHSAKKGQPAGDRPAPPREQ
jgi:1-acyl-sn-glycerol-3-phosphate acyltransferase